MEETCINTDVSFLGLFPAQVAGTYLRFGQTGTVIPTAGTCVTNQSKIGKTYRVVPSEAVVTYYTIRSPDFEIIDKIVLITPEAILRGSPTYRNSREPTKFLTFLKSLRTGVTHIKFGHISIIIRIRETA